MTIDFSLIAVLTIIISCLNATIILCFFKWRVFDYYEGFATGKKWLPKRCEFCTGFWLAVVEIILLIIFLKLNFSFLIVPFLTASLTRAIWIGNNNLY